MANKSSTNSNQVKKYKVIDTIPPDAPFGYINWVTISFLTPQKSEKTKYLEVIGFKIHNGYTVEGIADTDAKRLKTINKNHDIYTIEMGKLYAWDDITQSENVEYDDTKLNNLEQTRRENADKLKLMREQFKNEHSIGLSNTPDSRLEERQKQMRAKLYKEGKITQKEYELMQEKNKPLEEIKIEANEKMRLEEEATEAFKIDYLDVNEPVPLKYGCISIFTPKKIGNLKFPCFKVRGMFQTKEDLDARTQQLKKLYPDDPIFVFELGIWTVYSDSNVLQGEKLLMYLNYAMKSHLDTLVTEEEEFEKRKDTKTNEIKDQAKVTKAKNKKEARNEKRKAKLDKKNGIVSTPTAVNTPANTPTKKPNPVNQVNHSLREGVDDIAIRNIMDYLMDEGSRDRFKTEPQDRSNATVVEI